MTTQTMGSLGLGIEALIQTHLPMLPEFIDREDPDGEFSEDQANLLAYKALKNCAVNYNPERGTAFIVVLASYIHNAFVNARQSGAFISAAERATIKVNEAYERAMAALDSAEGGDDK